MKFRNAKIVGELIDPRVYHAEQKVKRGDTNYCVSRSDLAQILHNANRWVNGYQTPSSPSMRWGDVIDALVLTPEQYDKKVAIRPADYMDKKGEMKPWHGASNTCKEWMAKHEDKIIVTKEENEQAHEAASILRSDIYVAHLLDKAQIGRAHV